MKPSFKEALAQKITSEDQYIAILNGYDYYVGGEFGAMRLGTKDRKISWWAHREALRLEYQVYTTSTVLAELNKATKMHTHISLTDPKRVAYTPDKAFGEQDRQLVISLGKLISRLYPGLRDEEVQEMVQIHEAEISDEVEFIQGFEAIDHVYKHMGDLGACMSKSDDKYGGVSPLKAYDMPNIKLAVIRGHRGNITGRTMVYEASSTDKRFIRTYGDRVTIERRLAKLGYRLGTWHGAKFSMVVREDVQERLSDGRVAYVMPYLDGNNAAGGRSVSTVALIAGELTSVTDRYAQAVDALQYDSTAVCTDTSGYAVFRDFNPEKTSVYDYLTGEKISTLDRPTKLKVGSIFVFTAAEVPVDRYVKAKTIVDGEPCIHWMPRSDVWCGSGGAATDKKYLQRFGYVLLDATLYGPDQYVKESYCTETLDGKNVCSHDTVEVVGDSFVGIQRLHRSDIVAKGKDKHIKLADDVYAMPGTKLYTTPSGRKVHPVVHDVVKRYDGMYDYCRNLRETTLLGERIYVPKAGGAPTGRGSKIYRDIVQTRLEQGREVLCGGYPLVHVAVEVFDHSTDEYSPYSGYYVNSEGNTVRISISGALPVNEQMLNIERMAKAKGSDAAEVARYVCSILYAEMEAMEPGQLDRDMERLAAQARSDEAAQLAQSAATADLTYQSGLFNPEVDQYQTMHLTVPDLAQSAAETAANTATGGSDRLSLYELLRSRLDNNATTDVN